MNFILSLREITEEDRRQVGGKGFSLAAMARAGMNVPAALCVKADAYEQFIAVAGLKERILLELNRKNFQDMRWEEMWDTALRIRNMFLNTPLPAKLSAALRARIQERFQDVRVVVRSSAPDEDSSHTSFAGLHESYVNVSGAEAILEHIKRVWASLWSYGALLYRQELGLDFEHSRMAVVVQEIVQGDRSGVIFGKNPNDESQTAIEAVHGLNAGLVDGTVAPDRWILDRKSGKILSRVLASREKWMRPSSQGIQLEPLPDSLSAKSPLTDEEVGEIFDLSKATETLFGPPQDVEWTYRDRELFVLQSRPITTVSSETADDKRPWYLSLRRSFENLKVLRKKIEETLVPAMVQDAERFGQIDLSRLSDRHLAEEIRQRKKIYEGWVETYFADFVPFVHGMRLFGLIYNDTVKPQNPHEFMDLLGGSPLASLERNRMLDEMAGMIRNSPALAAQLRASERSVDHEFDSRLDAFVQKYGDLSCTIEGGTRCSQGKEGIIALLLEMAAHGSAPKKRSGQDIEALTSLFLSRFDAERRGFAEELLDLGRASYRMRDDDNIYLGRIEQQVNTAVDEGKRRTARPPTSDPDGSAGQFLIAALNEPFLTLQDRSSSDTGIKPEGLHARQIVGQPAGPGIARGKARVILDASQLFGFKAGEILVCDAVEPEMTFVVPLSAGIVERRGGMLIHGAIIAREYGLPCVTGVPHATHLIQTGDLVTVDGYLGIVIIG
jgi:phosphohistidine swiveling domain-containing protein